MLVLVLRMVAVFLLLAGAVSLAEDRGTIVERGKDRFETEFAPGERLELEVRSGEVHISGSDSNKVSIHYEGRRRGDVENVVVHCKKIEGGAALEVSGGPRNEFQIWIEVPRETELHVRMPFGELDIAKIHGAKDVELHAGQVNMEIGDPKDYAQIEASVLTGELNVTPLGVSKGGLFRSYKKDGPGKYRLYAHVGSGELDLD
ncbi:MAG: hypothetical protein WBE45_09360 [Terriglobales bacterium]